jgi:hypothetical protein
MLVAPSRKSNLSSIPEIEPFAGDADCRSADSAGVFSTLINPETDVLSFGVLLLKIISCRNARDAVECGLHSLSSLIGWALPLIKRGKALALCDPGIKFPLCTTDFKHMATIAGRCVHSPDSKLHTAAVNACEVVGVITKVSKLNRYQLYGRVPVLLIQQEQRNLPNTLNPAALSWASFTLTP